MALLGGFCSWRILSRMATLFGLVLFMGTVTARASDPAGLYALVEKVKFEPNDQHPERLLVWGTFSVADSERGDKYKAPEKGYLYFALPDKKSDVALKEWADIKSVAGKNQVIGLSSRYGEAPKVRGSAEEPNNPDTFRTGFGVIRMERRGPDYPPVKAILDSSKTAKSK